VRRLFDLDADPQRIAEHLGRDDALAPRLVRRPGLRIPGAWDGFETAVRAVLGQQVTVRGARTLAGRLAAAFGDPIDAGAGLTRCFPPAERLVDADLTRIGLPARRAAAINRLAAEVASGAIVLDGTADPERTRAQLLGLDGFGPWTADYIALRALGEPDAFPAGDLGLRKALGLPAAALAARAESWRPWRGYAAITLWSSLEDA
jgi:AraC family transcriptional regulator of adaptative response / DNA-3-methyladenine glycosylase II